jgi:hypothetical protein
VIDIADSRDVLAQDAVIVSGREGKTNGKDTVLSKSRRGRSFPSRMHGTANAIGGLAIVTDIYRDHAVRVEVVAVLHMRAICTLLRPRPADRTGVLSQRTVRAPQLPLRTDRHNASLSIRIILTIAAAGDLNIATNRRIRVSS